ncbi:hypothetical protein H8959_014644 [Pygathrix nigripes]
MRYLWKFLQYMPTPVCRDGPVTAVLELYGNEISSMECLCARPPAGLQHLGLGHNKLLGPLESLYVTADHWPNLVSLDLGFNDLTDLQSMVASLRTLRHLRLLVLQGNPLALVPYYRGLTIDSLAQLCVLDDITVSPNEKHLFRGLSLNGDLLAQEVQFVVTIGNLRGVLDTSVLDPEPGPEGPFIAYSYYVTYDFVRDEEGEADEDTGELAEIVKPSPSLELLVEESPEEVGEDVIKDIVGGVTEEVEGSLESEVEESGESELSVISGPSTILQTPRASAEELAKLRLLALQKTQGKSGVFTRGPPPWRALNTNFCPPSAHEVAQSSLQLLSHHFWNWLWSMNVALSSFSLTVPLCPDVGPENSVTWLFSTFNR